MKIIAEATWSWMLCAEEERRWLVVVCGSVGLYECAVELSPDERAAIAADPCEKSPLISAPNTKVGSIGRVCRGTLAAGVAMVGIL